LSPIYCIYVNLIITRATIALPIGAPDKIRVTAKDTPKEKPPSIFSSLGSSGTPAGSAGADVTTPPTVAKVSFIICMLTLLLTPLAGLPFCVESEFVTPSRCNLF
jgi:hypothetical protein